MTTSPDHRPGARPAPPPLPDRPEPVLLVIADISGYTRYMTANAKTLAHSQTIITELVTAIVREVELPLEVAKLEGDAVFLYGRKNQGDLPWAEAKLPIGTKLLTFFRLFGDKVGELSESTTCSCNACTHIEKLRLKVIVHSGEALFHHVFQFLELAGVDVITVHRLLKNSVAADQYLLMTDAGRQDLEFPVNVNFVRGTESYEDLGRIGTWIHLPGTNVDEGPREVPGRPTFLRRLGSSWKVFLKLWFGPLLFLRRDRQTPFRHLSGGSTLAGRIAFAVFTVIFTPLFVPVGFLAVLWHAIRNVSPSRG